MKPSNLHLFSKRRHFHLRTLPIRTPIPWPSGTGAFCGSGTKTPCRQNTHLYWPPIPPAMRQATFAVTDLGGRQVIPGFVDAHMHPVMLADLTNQIAVMPPAITSMDDLAAAIRERRSRQKPGQWILGWGYDEQGFLEKRSPNRYDLDRGCDDAPVMITRTCVHIRCVNSAALRLAGIDRNTPDPPGGMIERGTKTESPRES